MTNSASGVGSVPQDRGDAFGLAEGFGGGTVDDGDLGARLQRAADQLLAVGAEAGVEHEALDPPFLDRFADVAAAGGAAAAASHLFHRRRDEAGLAIAVGVL